MVANLRVAMLHYVMSNGYVGVIVLVCCQISIVTEDIMCIDTGYHPVCLMLNRTKDVL